MIYFFIIVCVALLIMEYKISGRIINVFSMFAFPYLLIIPANNFYFADSLGFYLISDDTIKMLLVGLFSIFAGCFSIELVLNKKNNFYSINTGDYIAVQSKINIKQSSFFVLFVEIIIIIRACFLFFSNGASWFVNSEGALLSGISGHLFFMIFPILPILFMCWLEDKSNKICLILYIIGFALAAISFVKYHVISVAIVTYLFVSMRNDKYLFKGVFLLGGVIVLLFIGNYFLGFIANNIIESVSNDFYINHLWMYISGSLIHDNLIFTTGINPNHGVLYKLLYCLLPLPNMFVKLFYGDTIKLDLNVSMQQLGKNNEAGNVIDFIGFYYPSLSNDFFDFISFIMFLFILGMVMSYIYYRSLMNYYNLNVTVCIILCFFCVLSFFGVYASLSSTWELIIWSFIITSVFNGKLVFGRLGRRR